MVPQELGGTLRSRSEWPCRAALTAMTPRAGVVDPTTLKVYGTQNVRVVDASLIPLQIATHIQSTVYAIAERVRDFALLLLFSDKRTHRL